MAFFLRQNGPYPRSEAGSAEPYQRYGAQATARATTETARFHAGKKREGNVAVTLHSLQDPPTPRGSSSVDSLAGIAAGNGWWPLSRAYRGGNVDAFPSGTFGADWLPSMPHLNA